jgi:hypothetical protein
MSLSPEERRRIYEEEKARLEARENLRPKRGHPFLVGCSVVIIAFFAFVVAAGILGLRHSPPSETPSAPAASDRTQPESSGWVLTARFHYNEPRGFGHFDEQLRPYTYSTPSDCEEDKALREAVLRDHPQPLFHTVPLEEVYRCEWAPTDMTPNPWHGQK